MKNNVLYPPLYSVDISDYWDIAGLPRTIAGIFIAPGTGNKSMQVPAIISFISPQPQQNISDWYFSIGENNSVAFFFKSRNSTKTIYKRKRKTPQSKKLHIDCTLYVNDDANTSTERTVIDRCLRPYIFGISDGINVRIIFNREIFEIKEYSARRIGSLIFRGSL